MNYNTMDNNYMDMPMNYNENFDRNTPINNDYQYHNKNIQPNYNNQNYVPMNCNNNQQNYNDQNYPPPNCNCNNCMNDIQYNNCNQISCNDNITDEYLLNYLLKKFNINKNNLIHTIKKHNESEEKKFLVKDFLEKNKYLENLDGNELYKLFCLWNKNNIHITENEFLFEKNKNCN